MTTVCRLRLSVLIMLMLLLVKQGTGQNPIISGRWVGRHFNAITSNLNNNLKGVIEDQAGFVWLASEGGLYRFNGAGFKYETKAVNKVIRSDRYYGFFEDPHHKMILVDEHRNMMAINDHSELELIGDSRQIQIIFTGAGQIITAVDMTKTYYKNLYDRAKLSFETNNEQVYIDSDTSYYYFDDRALHYVTISGEKNIRGFNETYAGAALWHDSLYILTGNGIFSIYKQGRLASTLKAEGITLRGKRPLLKQQEPGYWFVDGTMYKISPSQNAMVCTPLYTVPESDAYIAIYRITRSGMHILLTRTDGFYWFKPISGIQQLQYLHDKRPGNATYNVNNVYDVFEPEPGNLQTDYTLFLQYKLYNHSKLLPCTNNSANKKNIMFFGFESYVYSMASDKTVTVLPKLPDKNSAIW